MVNCRNRSRQEWPPNSPITHNDLYLGSLQRIADANELMAKNHRELVAERDRYEKWWRAARDQGYRIEASNRALRGVATKLRKRIAALEGRD